MGRCAVKESMEKAKVVLWLILMLCSFSVEAISRIKNIRYEGNHVTQVSVLEREVYVKQGDIVDATMLEKSRQGIMNLGLFKTVKVYLEEGYVESETSYEDANKETLVDVVFVVEEKYYLLIVPRARSDDDELHLGVQMRWNNVWGLNHEMRLLFENRGDTQGITEKRNRLKYSYPNINNSVYSLGLSLQTLNDVDEVNGVINRQDDIYQISISRWLNEQGRNRGWFAGGSVRYQQRFNEVVSGTLLSDNIEAVVLGFDGGFSDVNNYEFNRGGKSYGYLLDWSHESIGSEDEFTRHLLYYRSYYRFHKAPLSNLNVQTKLGHSNNNILGKSAFSLGSSDDLRGYENDRFNGNSLFLMNIEYMFPQKNYPVIRYVYFVDMGSTADKIEDLFHQPVNVGAGLGLRWKIRALVNIDLRADIGYGFTDNDYRFSFGTRHAF